jgi:hypothetical protein
LTVGPLLVDADIAGKPSWAGFEPERKRFAPHMRMMPIPHKTRCLTLAPGVNYD